MFANNIDSTNERLIRITPTVVNHSGTFKSHFISTFAHCLQPYRDGSYCFLFAWLSSHLPSNSKFQFTFNVFTVKTTIFFSDNHYCLHFYYLTPNTCFLRLRHLIEILLLQWKLIDWGCCPREFTLLSIDRTIVTPVFSPFFLHPDHFDSSRFEWQS